MATIADRRYSHFAGAQLDGKVTLYPGVRGGQKLPFGALSIGLMDAAEAG